MNMMLKRVLGVGVALAMTVAATTAVQAQTITEDTGTQILKELRLMRQSLQRLERQRVSRGQSSRRRPPTVVKVSEGDSYSLGSADAPFTLIEFSDLECPFCKRFHGTTFKQLKEKYIETGKLRYVVRDLPLPIHKNAFKASQAVRCAAEQGQYWQLRDLIFENSENLKPEAILKYAQGLPMNRAMFQTCFESDKYKKQIQRDMRDARAAGLGGTPSFVLGKTAKDGIVGFTIVGAQPLSAFEAAMKQLRTAIIRSSKQGEFTN